MLVFGHVELLKNIAIYKIKYLWMIYLMFNFYPPCFLLHYTV